MPNKNFPLQTILDLAQSQADDAAKELGRLLASEQQDEQRLKLLVDYRQEYAARFTAAARDGIGRDAWLNYRAFLTRLDEAIEAQTQAVALAKGRTAAGQRTWVGHRNKVKAFDTLSQKHQQAQLRHEARAEQRLSDEHAAQHFGQGGEEEG